MKDFKTELLREKFVIHDPGANPAEGKGPIIALSNRVVLELKDDKGALQETMIIRGQNMQSDNRKAARILQSFISSGPLLNRSNPYDWETSWDIVSGDYEKSYNPQRWITVYNKGRAIFERGDHHPFLDIIEKCAADGKGQYETSMKLAEKVIKQSGKVVNIEYDGNVALNVALEKKQGRCGIILRSPNKTTIFSFSIAAKEAVDLNYPQCLGSAAAFLEGIQLAFMVGMNNEKIKRGIIPRHSQEESQTRESGNRLVRLNAEIANLEGTFDVHYRPERPDLQVIMMNAERLARQILPQPGKKA